jgi:hypothetical protein
MDESFGICNLSVVPVRTEPSDRAEIGTQLLFGDVFTILKKSLDEKWVYIKIAYDNYLGWIDFKQFKPITKDYFELVTSTEFPLCGVLTGTVSSRKISLPILFGSSLPFYKDETIVLENDVFDYSDNFYLPLKEFNFSFMEEILSYYLNAPYLWGGKSPFGIDCSGFIQQVFRFCGQKMPRDAYQQAECGTEISFGELKAGDLAFFSNDAGKVVHVGIILKNKDIIHASGQVRIDSLDEKGIYNRERKVYSHKLSSIKRIFY